MRRLCRNALISEVMSKSYLMLKIYTFVIALTVTMGLVIQHLKLWPLRFKLNLSVHRAVSNKH